MQGHPDPRTDARCHLIFSSWILGGGKAKGARRFQPPPYSQNQGGWCRSLQEVKNPHGGQDFFQVFCMFAVFKAHGG